MMGRPASSRAALFLLLITTCDVQSAAQARSRVLGPAAATWVAAIRSAPPVPSAFSTSPVPSAFPNCDSLAHLASVTSVSCDGGSVLGQFALECTNSTEPPLGSPLAPSLRLGGGSASVAIGSPAGIPLFSEAGDVLVASSSPWSSGSGCISRAARQVPRGAPPRPLQPGGAPPLACTGKGKGKGKAGTVATVATVDQFIRHAESGFFGGDEEADCPFAPSCGTATAKLPPAGGAPVSPADGRGAWRARGGRRKRGHLS